MNNEKPDYSIFTSDDDWSLTDAAFIVKSYNSYLLSSKGITDLSAVDGYTRKLIQRRNAFVDTDKFVSYQLFDECGNPEYDENNNEEWEIDCDKTKVNIKDFIKWAYREKVPLPEEIVNMIRPVAKDQSPEVSGNQQLADSVDPGNIIEATIQAIKYCLDNKRGLEVSPEEILHILELKGFDGINESTKHEIWSRIPKDVRTAAVPLSGEERQAYGMLKLQKDNMFVAIRAAVDATEHISELAQGSKINALEMYDWLYGKGYKDLTKRMHEQIWQALPPKNKKPSGKKTKKE